jgi:4-amino-4-deoxy-L-arabinose transferase-like glycosyltransferase
VRKREIIATSSVSLAALLCLLGQLGAIGLVGPDEPRYAWIARAMAQSGDWVTPRLYGSPWFEKPILYYWAAAIGFRLQLPAEWAARLPSALAALAVTMAAAWLGWKHYATERYCTWSPALLAPLFFSTSVAAIGFSRAATPDMLFAAFIALAMACAATAMRRAGVLRSSIAKNSGGTTNNDRTAVVLFGAFLGAAVLAKGPAAIVLAAGAIGIWALATRRWRPVIRLLHPLGIFAFSVVALPWYVACAVRNPEFVHIFIFEHNFERYLTPVFQHRQPFWFFIPITLLAIIPWLPFVLSSAADGARSWREIRWRDSPAFFFSCWAIFPVLFFSFSQSKLPGYVLPAAPAIALVLAISASRMIEQNSPRNGWIFALVGVTWFCLGIGGLVWLRRLPQNAAADLRTPTVICVLVAVVGGITIIVLARNRQRATVWISLFLVCTCLEIGALSILPKLDPYYSARSVGTNLRSDLRPDRLFIYRVPRAWQYGVAFYLGRELREWDPDDRKAALLLTTREACEELRANGFSDADCEEAQAGIVTVPVLPRSVLPRLDTPKAH